MSIAFCVWDVYSNGSGAGKSQEPAHPLALGVHGHLGRGGDLLLTEPWPVPKGQWLPTSSCPRRSTLFGLPAQGTEDCTWDAALFTRVSQLLDLLLLLFFLPFFYFLQGLPTAQAQGHLLVVVSGTPPEFPSPRLQQVHINSAFLPITRGADGF